jgi:16S rRNA (guanine527-N7)-methyltransferase
MDAMQENFDINVSRETSESLKLYLQELLKWNEKFNLVGESTVPIAWDRHILNSLEVYKYLENNDIVMDVGSGAGLPGLMLAISGVEKVYLIEPSRKRAAFLRQMIRLLNLKNCIVIEDKVENLEQIEGVTVITCRAFANMSKIFELTQKQFRKGLTRYILLKGAQVENEKKESNELYRYDEDLIPLAEKEGHIVIIRDLERIGE